MEVKVIDDYYDVPEGTIIYDVEEINGNYEGLWSSSEGTYHASVLVEYCEIISE